MESATVANPIASKEVSTKPEESIDQIIEAFDGCQDISLSKQVLENASNYQLPDCSNYFNSQGVFEPTQEFTKIKNNNLALLLILERLYQLPTNTTPGLKESFEKHFFNGHSNGSSSFEKYYSSETQNDY
ncbi:hypothetical protein KY358_04655, partial [Candidatus Woesearchaeota archaeon]|nr:hypothetical protein [Candidatus Woesearchaeota archaeon]